MPSGPRSLGDSWAPRTTQSVLPQILGVTFTCSSQEPVPTHSVSSAASDPAVLVTGPPGQPGGGLAPVFPVPCYPHRGPLQADLRDLWLRMPLLRPDTSRPWSLPAATALRPLRSSPSPPGGAHPFSELPNFNCKQPTDPFFGGGGECRQDLGEPRSSNGQLRSSVSSVSVLVPERPVPGWGGGGRGRPSANGTE